MKSFGLGQNQSYKKFQKTKNSAQLRKEFSVSSSKSKTKNQKSFSLLSSVSLQNSKISALQNSFKDHNLLYKKNAQKFEDRTKQFTLKEMKKQVQKVFREIRLFLDQLVRDFDKALQSTLNNLRKDFQQFLREKPEQIQKSSLYSSEELRIQKFPVFKIKHVDSLKDEEMLENKKKVSFRNPFNVKRELQKNANVRNSQIIYKNRVKEEELKSQTNKKVNKVVYQSPTRGKRESVERSASKEVIKFQQKLISLRNILNN